jgi:hypothetical protein
MFQNLGLFGSYIAWIVLFILLSGAVFGSLVVVDRWRLPKFYLLWAVAFFAYAAVWMITYSISGVQRVKQLDHWSDSFYGSGPGCGI